MGFVRIDEMPPLSNSKSHLVNAITSSAYERTDSWTVVAVTSSDTLQLAS